MSVIKAGTTLTTAYTVEADTTGALEFKTGTSATLAMSISASGVVTFPATTGFDIASANITNLTSGTTSATVLRSASGTITNLLATTLTISGVGVFPAGTVSAPAITTSGDSNTGIFFPAADTIAFTEGGVEAARFDSAGNFGLGVTPSSWVSFTSAFQFGAVGGLASADFGGSNVQTFFGNNIYYGGSPASFRAIKTNVSTIYRQVGKTHVWGYSESTTAGNAITLTEAMTLDASGNLGIGTTSPSARLHVSSAPDANWGVETLFDTTSATTGVGGVLALAGYKTSTSAQAIFAKIAGIKENSTGGNEAGALTFITNSNSAYVERARFNSTGAFVFAGGTTTANGIGITFPATQSASSDANTLDDYEEGTFTPQFFGTVSNPTTTYTRQTGRYVKIGRMVYCAVAIVVNTTSGGSGILFFNVPFTAASTLGNPWGGAVTWNGQGSFNTNQPVNVAVIGGTAAAYMHYMNATNGTFDNSPSDLANSCNIEAFLMYEV